MACNLKMAKIILDLLIDIDMLSMVEKSIRGNLFNTIHWYAKSINKYMRNYDEKTESSYPKQWDGNNVYWWECHKSYL